MSDHTLSSIVLRPFRSIGTTRTPSPSDLMTRLSRFFFFFITRCHFDVPASSHFTLHRAQMSHVPKKTVFFTPSDHTGGETEEMHDDLARPRTVLYKNSCKIS